MASKSGSLVLVRDTQTESILIVLHVAWKTPLTGIRLRINAETTMRSEAEQSVDRLVVCDVCKQEMQESAMADMDDLSPSGAVLTVMSRNVAGIERTAIKRLSRA